MGVHLSFKRLYILLSFSCPTWPYLLSQVPPILQSFGVLWDKWVWFSLFFLVFFLILPVFIILSTVFHFLYIVVWNFTCTVVWLKLELVIIFSSCFRVRRSREIFTLLSLIKSSSSHFSFHFYPGLQILSLLPWLPDLYFQTWFSFWAVCMFLSSCFLDSLINLQKFASLFF